MKNWDKKEIGAKRFGEKAGGLKKITLLHESEPAIWRFFSTQIHKSSRKKLSVDGLFNINILCWVLFKTLANTFFVFYKEYLIYRYPKIYKYIHKIRDGQLRIRFTNLNICIKIYRKHYLLLQFSSYIY